LRVYPKDKDAAASLARQVIELVVSQDWKIEQLRSEEGQLDEVFRRITLPDTVREAAR
jgi:ABC-2 type transport system ATP-binding protein